jgi:hypothetical protein
MYFLECLTDAGLAVSPAWREMNCIAAVKWCSKYRMPVTSHSMRGNRIARVSGLYTLPSVRDGWVRRAPEWMGSSFMITCDAGCILWTGVATRCRASN